MKYIFRTETPSVSCFEVGCFQIDQKPVYKTQETANANYFTLVIHKIAEK